MPEDKERSQRSKIDELERECAEIEERLLGLLPPDFVLHLRAAHKELLLAARSLIDAKIARLEAREKRRATRRATKVPVE